ncbi:MAG: tRNA (adenosine(37)-N6)-threonylcarbamoyltransferase complex ATPase subunit type 1 TsaE [Bacteroidetes bacterium]|nr:MAG: tRNA (adenosine(37)-N6)-threonylcarbamoyltransferase complex ATPase subunit type 1 TsaE [Bacteroidota bacterium]
MEILIKDKKHLAAAAKKLLKYCGDYKIFAFYGSMGTGKTTIIKAICEVLGVVDIISSPTFTLVNEYRISKGDPIYHIDFYRIKKQEEVFDFGIEEYLTSDSYCFMEWPEIVEEMLPPGTVRVRITVDDKEQRFLQISF